MGYRTIEVTENTVVVRGSMRDVMRLNLCLRTAHRVLVPLLRTTCRNIRDLYESVKSIDWENLLDADGYFSVSSVVHNHTIRDTRIPSLYTKDAVVDRIHNLHVFFFCGRPYQKRLRQQAEGRIRNGGRS